LHDVCIKSFQIYELATQGPHCSRLGVVCMGMGMGVTHCGQGDSSTVGLYAVPPESFRKVPKLTATHTLLAQNTAAVWACRPQRPGFWPPKTFSEPSLRLIFLPLWRLPVPGRLSLLNSPVTGGQTRSPSLTTAWRYFRWRHSLSLITAHYHTQS
jgi:hypothetical protein